MNTTTLRFNTSTGRQFQTELRKRVDSYFKDNEISKNGNLTLYFKTIVMFAAYLGPYFLLVFNVFESKSIWLLFSVIMALGCAVISARPSRRSCSIRRLAAPNHSVIRYSENRLSPCCANREFFGRFHL